MNGRVPPQNIEAEMAVLGAMLLGDRGAIERVTEVLSKEDFYREAHSRIYEAMLGLSERDEPVDIVTLKDELTRRGVLEQVGGYLYLMQLAEFVPTTANITYYAKIVAEKGVLRRLIETASEIAGLAYGEIEEVDTLVDQAERAIFNVARKRRSEGFTPLRPLLTNAFEQIDTLYHEKGITTGVNTGFKDLNYITSGLQPGDLIIIAARPSMGKCLTARMLVDNPDTGERLTIEEAVQRRMPRITGISECGRVRATEVSDWIDSGIKPVFRVTTRTGRFVEVTGHHPFLTLHGWQPLHDLTVGDQIAVPRLVPVFGGNETLTQERVRLLAYLIAEGGLTDSCPEWTNTDPTLIADFRDIIAREFPELRVRQDGITYIVAREYVAGQRKNQPNPLIEWLRELDLWGKKADAKSFPDCVWEWPEHYLALFLQVLMSCDATIYDMGGFPRIEFAVASERLARDVQHALLRFGVVAKFWQKSARCWRVEVTDPEAVERYQAKVGWLGEKAGRQFAHQRQTRRRGNAGHPNKEIWDLVRARAAAHSMSLTELARRAGECGTAEGFNPHTNRGLPRHRLAAYAEVLQDANLQKVASPELYWDTIVAIESLGEQQVYDLTVPNGANFIAQDIVVHNTALTMNIGQNAALIDNKVVATFSLEMSKESLVQRLICSEARVDAHKLRTGFLQDEDWSRLADAVQRLWDAPLFIDDTTDMSALEMRAKCRRLRAEQGQLDLVIVDYLQLMRGSSRNSENRNQEITEIARGLKSLARELEVPVIALSQLSRSVERREDKRPMLSDLRECLTGETRLWDAETGLLVPIREVRPGQRVLTVDKNQKVVAAEVSQVWEKGVKPIFRVTTETGRVIRCTDNHPFLTPSGYVPLGQLDKAALVGTAMRLPTFGSEADKCASLCRFLGYMIGDGHYGKHRTSSFIASDRAVFDDCIEIVSAHFAGVTAVEMPVTNTKSPCWEVDFVAYHGAKRYGKPFGNSLLNWFRELGVLGQLCHTKRVPEFVFASGETGAAHFLSGYLATDGCVKVRGTKWDVHFDTVSLGLARDVQLLLQRLGVVASIQEPQRKHGKYRPIYRISVHASDMNLRRFATLVQPCGRKGELLRTFLASEPHTTTNPGIFSLPLNLSSLLAEKTAHLKQQGKKLPTTSGRLYWKDQGKRLRRDICRRWAERLQDEELSLWADSDLLWERIRSIEPDGEEETFDICVPETGCFLAEGLVVHNSGAIEAEADVVGFIYRPAYYARKEAISQEGEEKADEDRGGGVYEGEEAEVIIAKQRNGPTGTVKLAFLPKFARFADLEQNLEESPF